MPHVYLVQPVELVGTNRYKIGMSSLSNLSRIRSYKNGTRYLCVFEKTNALATEQKLIRAFRQRYRLIGGNEYFEVDDEQQMIELFIATAMGYPVAQPVAELAEPVKELDSSTQSIDWIKKYAFES